MMVKIMKSGGQIVITKSMGAAYTGLAERVGLGKDARQWIPGTVQYCKGEDVG